MGAQLGDSFPKGIPGASKCAPSCLICITSGRAEGKDLVADGRDLGIFFFQKVETINCLGRVPALSAWETFNPIGVHFVYNSAGALAAVQSTRN